jgi:hypothetical protein
MKHVVCRWYRVLAVMLLAACGSGGGGETPPPLGPPRKPPEVTVSLVDPSPVRCLKTPVPIQVIVEGATPSEVHLLNQHRSRIATLQAPFQYSFDCANAPEGAHRISAEVMVQAYIFSSPEKSIEVLEHTPPTTSGPFGELVLARDLPKTAPVQVTFSEPMNTERVSVDSVSVLGNTVQGISWSEDKQVLTVALDTAFEVPKTFTLSLRAADFQDLVGNGLAPSAKTQWTWTVPEFAALWRVPQLRSLGGLSPPPAALALDRSRRMLVAGTVFSSVRRDEVYVYRSGPEGDTPLGGTLSESAPESYSEIIQLALAVDGADRPVVAWSEPTGTGMKLFVRRWTGSLWEELGGLPSLPPSQSAFGLSLSTGPSELPVLAWNLLSKVYVYRWNGTGWDALGDPLSGRTARTEAGGFSLVVDSENRPHVAYVEEQTATPYAHRALVVRWEGSGWVQVGSDIQSINGERSFNLFQWLNLALDPQGRPALAFEVQETDDASLNGLYFTRYGDSGWASLQKVAGGETPYLTFGFDAAGTPWLAWQARADFDSIVNIVRLDGASPRTVIRKQAFRPTFANDGVGVPMLLIGDDRSLHDVVITQQ